MAIRRGLRWLLVGVVLVIVAALGGTALAYHLSRPKTTAIQRQARGPFATDPVLVARYTPTQFGLRAFVPVLGTGNSVAPVAYGKARIMAGATRAGDTQLFALADDGRATWQTSLIGPLVACAATPAGNQLPCLVRTSTGSAVATVDVTTGAAKWIFEDAHKYINIAVADDGQFWLLGTDFSITPIGADGVQQSEARLLQPPTDKDLTPDVHNCGLGSSSTRVPERFAALSKNLWVISHGGLNRFVTPDNNQLVAAVPGPLLHAADGQDTLAVAPPDGCAPAALVHPGRARVQLLPANVSLPTPTDGTIPNLVLRAGKLHSIDWAGPAVGARSYAGLSLSFQGTPRMLQTNRLGVVAGDSQVSGFWKHPGQSLWTIGLRAHALALAGDVLLAIDDRGVVQGLNVYTGENLWQADQAALGTLAVRDDNTFVVAAQNGVFTWRSHAKAAGRGDGNGDTGAGVREGRGVEAAQPAPGISYGAGGCVRVHKLDGTDKAYTATSVRVKCSLVGAEKIVAVITSAELARGSAPGDFLSKCLARDPSSVSALTVTSGLADQSVAALCTGQVTRPAAARTSGEPDERAHTTPRRRPRADQDDANDGTADQQPGDKQKPSQRPRPHGKQTQPSAGKDQGGHGNQGGQNGQGNQGNQGDNR